jgi:hypothetical protein
MHACIRLSLGCPATTVGVGEGTVDECTVMHTCIPVRVQQDKVLQLPVLLTVHCVSVGHCLQVRLHRRTGRDAAQEGSAY